MDETKSPPSPTEQPIVDPTVTQILTVDAKRLGYLIGPKGATRKAIKDKTGVQVSMPRTDKDAEGTVDVTVTGLPEGVATACRALRELHDKGYTSLLGGDDFAEVNVPVHPM